VTVLVIDHLEVIDVDEHERDLEPMALGAQHFPLDRVLQMRMVEQARQGVARDQVLQLEQLLALVAPEGEAAQRR